MRPGLVCIVGRFYCSASPPPLSSDRQLRERDSLRRRLAQVSRQRERAQQAGHSPQQLQELDDTAEAIRANLDYIADSLRECQAAVVALEEAREDVQEPELLLAEIGAEQRPYLLQKLLAMTVHQSCLAAQHQAAEREANSRVEQVLMMVARLCPGQD